MKKFLLMLAMMLPCLGAWAEVASLKVSTDAQKYYYVIKNFRSHKFAYYNGDSGQLLQQTNPTSTTAQADLDKYLWYVTEAEGEGAYMLHNVATTNVYAAYNSFTKDGAVVYIKENPYKAGYVCVSSNADATTKNSCWDDQGSKTKIGPYETRQNDNEGTSWEFIEVEETTCNFTLIDNAENTYSGSYTGYKNLTVPATIGASSLTNIVWDNANLSANVTFAFPISKVNGATNWTYIKTRPISSNEAYFYANSDYVKFKTQKNTNLSYLPSSDVNEIAKYMWTIYPKYNSATGKFTFNIKNSASNKYLPAVSGAINSIQLSETAGDFSWDTANNGYYGFCIPNTNIFLNAGTSNPNEQTATFWAKSGNTNHQGVNLVFCDPIYKATCNITDNSGNEYSWLTTINYTSDENDVERPNITGIPSTLISNIQWNEGVCSADVNFYFVASTPSKDNPTMISTYNYNGIKDSHKWYASDNKVKVEKEDEKIAKGNIVTESNIATHLWMIYPNFDNGAFTFKIKNLATGLFINSSAGSSQHDATSTVTLSKEASNFTLGHRDGSAIEFINNANYRLSVNSSGADKGEQTVGTHTSHYGSAITFPTVSYKVNVSEVGYATLYSPIAGAFDGDVETYAIESASNNSATLEEKTGVAANEGAIIKAAEGTYTFTAREVSSDWSKNLLKGTSVNTMVNESAYVLAFDENEGKAVLALADLNKDEAGATGTTHFLNNAGKAYLPASAVSTTAQTLRFNFGGTTGIEDAIVAPSFDANAPIYDLSGRRVMNAVKGGLYIQNGKKFIIR